jgi:hypothetical protein
MSSHSSLHIHINFLTGAFPNAELSDKLTRGAYGLPLVNTDEMLEWFLEHNAEPDSMDLVLYEGEEQYIKFKSLSG